MNYPKHKGRQSSPKSPPKNLSKLNLKMKPEVGPISPKKEQLVKINKPKSPEKSLIVKHSVSFPENKKSSSPLKNRLISPVSNKKSPQKLMKLNRHVQSPKSMSFSESPIKTKSQPNFYFSKAFINFVNNYSEIDQNRHKLFIGGFKTKEIQLYNNIMNTINEFIVDPNIEQHYNLYKKYLSNPSILVGIKKNSNKIVLQKFNKHIDELLSLVLKYRILINEKNETEQQYSDLFYNIYFTGVINSQKEKKDMDAAEKALEKFEKTYNENINKKIEMYFLDIIEVYNSYDD